MNNSTATARIISSANDIQKPRRPLSSFNLFYRYKRQHIIRLLALSNDDDVDKDAICRLIMTPPGLEEYYNTLTAAATRYAASTSTQAEVDTLRCHCICFELKNLQARDHTKRLHRKSMNGIFTFIELNKVMQTGWKECDDVAKAVFNKLSEENREVYRLQMKEYDDLCKALGITKQKQTKKVSKKKKKKHDCNDEPPATAIAGSKPLKKMKLSKKKEEIPVDALSPTPPVGHLSSSSHEVTDHEAAEAMLILGTTGQKSTTTLLAKNCKTTSGPLKKRACSFQFNEVEQKNAVKDVLTNDIESPSSNASDKVIINPTSIYDRSWLVSPRQVSPNVNNDNDVFILSTILTQKKRHMLQQLHEIRELLVLQHELLRNS